MYTKYKQRDELLSSVLIAFALFVMFGILFYFIYQDTGGWTPSSILYLVFAGLSLLYSLYYTVLYLINERRPLIDYQIDLKEEVIILNRWQKIAFQDIQLYAVRKNRSEIKIFHRFRILNIIAFQLENNKQQKLTLADADKIGKYAHKIGHRRLYNYNFLLPFVVISFNLIFLFIQDNFLFLHQTYQYLIVLGITIGLSILIVMTNVLLLRRLYKAFITEPKEKL
jgi:hypothetical protein